MKLHYQNDIRCVGGCRKSNIKLFIQFNQKSHKCCNFFPFLTLIFTAAFGFLRGWFVSSYQQELSLELFQIFFPQNSQKNYLLNVGEAVIAQYFSIQFTKESPTILDQLFVDCGQFEVTIVHSVDALSSIQPAHDSHQRTQFLNNRCRFIMR